MKIIRFVCVSFFLVISGCGNSTANSRVNDTKKVEDMPALKNVQTKSDFSIPNLNGQMIDFSKMKEKKIVLNFWATWCPPCKEEMKDLEAFYQIERNKKDGVALIGVNLTTQEWSQGSVGNYVADQKLTFPIGLDIDGEFTKKFGIQALPTTIIVDEHLNVLKKHIGPLTLPALQELLAETN